MHKHEVLSGAADHIENVGWVRGDYEEGHRGPTCLVGGISVAMRSPGRVATSYKLSSDVAFELDKVLGKDVQYQISKRITRFALEHRDGGPSYPVRNEEYIQEAVEFWNDMPWRRKSEVVKALRKAATNAKSEFFENRIAWLEKEVQRLEARISELETELAEHKQETSRLKRILGQKTQDQIVLQQLSDELNQRWDELNSLAI